MSPLHVQCSRFSAPVSENAASRPPSTFRAFRGAWELRARQVSDHAVRPQPRITTRRAGVRAPSPFACAHRRGGPARRTPARAPGCVADCSGRCPSVGTSCTMTTTDAEEVHRLRQRLEKSEATRAKLRASLIALKVRLSEVSPPPPPPPPRARARSPRPDVPASIARANAHLPVPPVPTHTEPSNLRTRNRTVPRTRPDSSLLAVPRRASARARQRWRLRGDPPRPTAETMPPPPPRPPSATRPPRRAR